MEQHTTVSISAALKEFQDNLDPSQQAELLAIHGATIPDGNTVLAFTAEIDRKRYKARCVASRLHGTLQSVQQFTQIVSTFVSSHPAIAALIWGSIRFTILVASNFSSFFDKLSEWFMTLQGICPRLSEYQFIYADSVRLQNTLCSFYATLVRFCTKAMVAMRRTGLQRITNALWNPFENEFSDCTSSLQRLKKELQAEIRLASDQAAFRERELQVLDRKQAEKDRKLGRAFYRRTSQFANEERTWRLEIREREEKIRKQQVLDQLSTHNYIAPLKRLRRRRYGDTGLWLSETQEYLEWITKRSTSVFWLHGILGSGKSVLTSTIIDDLLRRGTSSALKPLFFFFEHDDVESLQSGNVLRCLLRQCLSIDTLSEEIEQLVVNTTKDSTPYPEDFVNAFCYLSGKFPEKMYIVMDGLDEASSGDRDFILAVLRSLTLANIGLKVFVASRHDIGHQLRSYLPVVFERSTNCIEIDGDVSNYVSLSIEANHSSGRLVVGDAGLLGKIREALCKKAKRMFLWVYFQMEDICSQTCDRDISVVLENLPSDLLETYERILLKITHDGRANIVRKLFEWIATAERPLTLSELREAIAIYPGQPYSMPDRQINDKKAIIPWCRSLVTLDEYEQTVHFAHYTIKDFLTSTSITASGAFKIDLNRTGDFVGEICCTYLAFNDFKTQLMRLDNTKVSLAPQKLVMNALSTNSMSLISKWWSALERSRKVQPTGKNDADAYRRLQILAMDNGMNSLPKLQEHHQFLAYASQFWMNHTRRIASESVMYRDWKNLVFGSEMPGAKAWTPEEFQTGEDHIIECIIDNNHVALLEILVRNELFGPNENPQQRDVLPKLWKWIARTGTLDLFDVLCSTYPAISFARWEAAFDCAVFGNQATIMRRLLRGTCKDPQSRIVIIPGKDPLDCVDRQLCYRELYEMAAPLVEKALRMIRAFVLYKDRDALKAILNIQIGYHHKSTEFEDATACAHLETLENFLTSNFSLFTGKSQDVDKFLLDSAIEVADLEMIQLCLSRGSDPSGALVTALEPGPAQRDAKSQLQTVQKLLQAGADPNSRNGVRNTPLIAAIQSGNSPELIQALLQAGADPNGRNSTRNTPLIAAIQGLNSLESIQELLQAGADPNAKDGKQRTPLITAIKDERPLSLQIQELLRAGADPNAKDEKQRTPLTIAIEYANSPQIVQELLQAGADPNTKDMKQQTPLIIAIRCASEPQIIQELLRAGADPNATNDRRLTPLIMAIKYANSRETVRELLQAGADPNTRDDQGQTPLIAAVESADSEVILVLLEHGAERLDFTELELREVSDLSHEKRVIAYLKAENIYDGIGNAR